MTDSWELQQTNPDFLGPARERVEEMTQVGLAVVELTETILGAPLPEPTEKRDETVLPTEALDSRAKEKAIRAALTELGIGMESDRGLAEAGISQDALVLIEGGQRHKIVAETHLIGTGPVIFSATKNRLIDEKEKELTARIFGLNPEDVGNTEFDLAYDVAQSLEGFEPVETEVVATLDAFAKKDGEFEKGTLIKIGTVRQGTQPIYVFDVPREYKYDTDGNPVYDDKDKHSFDQPSSGQQLVAFAKILGLEEAAVATSATYYPSRLAQIVRATFLEAAQTGVSPAVEVIAYCPSRLAKVKGEEEPAIPTLANMLGEAYATRKAIQQLQQDLL